MEISNLTTLEAHEEGAEIRIKHPVTGEETDFYIKVQGPDSKAWRKAISDEFRELVRAKAEEEEFDEMESDMNKLLAVSVDWRGLSEDGKDVPFSKEKCKWLYENSPGIAQQVNIFLGKSENFIKG